MTAASLATPAGVRVRTGRFGVTAWKGFLRTPSTDTHLISLSTQLLQLGCRTCCMSGDWLSSQTTSEHHVTEHAVLPSEIEQPPDLSRGWYGSFSAGILSPGMTFLICSASRCIKAN